MSYRQGGPAGSSRPGSRAPAGGGSRPAHHPPRTGTDSANAPNYVNNNANSLMHYPPVLAKIENTAPSQGEDWNLPAEMKNRTALSKIKEPIWPLRKAFSEDIGQGKILTNHFTYTLTVDKLYEYRILDLPAEKIDRQVKKQNFEKAVQACSFLQTNQGSFATNDIDTIISWKPIHKQISTSFTVTGVEEDYSQVWSGIRIYNGSRELPLRFAFVRETKVQDLKHYSLAHPGHEQTNFVDIARCLNILISHSLTSDVYKQSANKFFVKTSRSRLVPSISLETVRGYFYSVKPGMGNIIVNFNIATSAFIRPLLVSEFLNDRITFTTTQVEAVLKKLRVYVEYDRRSIDAEKTAHLNKEKTRTWSGCNLSVEPIGKLKFQNKKRGSDGKPLKDGKNFIYEGEQHSVMDHLKKVFGKTIDPTKRAVNVGKKDEPIWYPQEFLRIVPFQVYTKQVPENLTAAMVKEACRDPAESRMLIEMEGLRSLGFVPGKTSSSFNLRSGVPVQLHCGMLKIPYQNIGFPTVLYHNNTPAMRASGWPIKPNFRFFNTSPRPFKYAVLRVSDVNPSSPEYYDSLLKGQFARCGLQVLQAQNMYAKNDKVVASPRDLGAALKTMKDQGALLVILVIRQADRSLYCEFKNIAERLIGIQSICIVERLTKPDKFFIQYMQNISMKLNLKLGGVNHTALQPNERLIDTMILGADLIHPSSGSIAAVVGSVDAAGGKCLGSVRLQPIQDADGEITDREIIYTMEDMVEERLLHYAKFNSSKLPEKIIYYRDGVSTGHYIKVKTLELSAINRAYAKVRTKLKLPAKELKLTAIIVTKRHHTRFYVLPGQKGDLHGNGNTHPGTCVDKLVTSPYYQDFFLQSHSGIKGTAKPTHYCVIEDGIPSMSLEKLRDLTHKLCYSYCRATMGVSYASPTYYADRLCERASLYVRKIAPGEIPWGKPRLRTPEGSCANDPNVDYWFKELEKKFYPNKDVPGVPAWGKYAPWKGVVADTMFWM